MNHYARVVGGIAVEVWNDGGLNLKPVDVHVPALAKQFKPCPSHVLPGAVIINGEWVNPEPIVIEQADNDGET
ncbi:hypothetical protein CF126_19665 [Aeromonas dhakensis]|uniref:hypothetical protein n=1 Tax=Aeromonas dhakensis TaxID=196024 RepID=UPI00111A582F|nr:hypothetical protein [Aeromonas dhakensis]TNI52971.1 hypothetical protein CF126_19665 [Aeromonas dhakensis]